MFNKDKEILGEKGGNTAYNGGGYGIEFDRSGREWNEWDPEGSHIGLIKETTEENLQLKEDERVADNLWHDAVVQVTRNSIKVKIDNDIVIDYEGDIDL